MTMIKELETMDLTMPEEARVFYKQTVDDYDTITSDVYRMLGFGTNRHKNRVGSLFQYLSRNKYIERVGYEKSVIPSNSGREIKTWVWTDKARKEFR